MIRRRAIVRFAPLVLMICLPTGDDYARGTRFHLPGRTPRAAPLDWPAERVVDRVDGDAP